MGELFAGKRHRALGCSYTLWERVASEAACKECAIENVFSDLPTRLKTRRESHILFHALRGC